MKIPARMSFEDCAREAERSFRRRARAERLVVPAKLSRASVYKGGEVNRLVEDWIATIMHPDEELRWSLRRMRARSREQGRNNPYAKAYLGALTVNVLGPSGPKLQAEVRDNSGNLNDRINDKIEEAFYEWARRPTVDGKLTLAGFSHLMLRTAGGDGEGFVRLWRGFDNPWSFAIEAVDADQIDELYNVPPGRGQPEVRLGIEVDSFGRPLGYHAWNRPDYAMSSPRERIRIPASEVIHLFNHERVNQTRGLPWTHVVMWALKMLEGYSEAEVVAARTAAAKMGFWTRVPKEGTYGEIPVDKQTGAIALDAAPGSFDFGPEGYQLQPWDPQHPSANYADFVKAKLREIASGLGMSYNALANDLEGVNYSSMRSGLLIEREVWRSVQRWWIEGFLQPIFEEWLNMALLSGALTLDSRNSQKFKAHRWAPRGWQWVDPLKDTTAGIAGIKTGLTSRRRLLAEQGIDFDTVIEELAEEDKRAREKGVDISGPKSEPTGFAAASKDEDEDDDKPKDGKNGKKSRDEVLRALRG